MANQVSDGGSGGYYYLSNPQAALGQGQAMGGEQFARSWDTPRQLMTPPRFGKLGQFQQGQPNDPRSALLLRLLAMLHGQQPHQGADPASLFGQQTHQGLNLAGLFGGGQQGQQPSGGFLSQGLFGGQPGQPTGGGGFLQALFGG